MCFTSLMAQYLYQVFGILLYGKFVYSPLLIYLFNNLSIPVGAPVTVKILTYLFCCSNYSSFDHCELFHLIRASLHHIPSLVCFLLFYFWTLPHVPVLWDALSSSYKFPAPVLDSATSLRKTDSFYCRTVLATKIWALDVLTMTAVSLLLGSLSWPREEIFVCMLPATHVFIHIYKYLQV